MPDLKDIGKDIGAITTVQKKYTGQSTKLVAISEAKTQVIDLVTEWHDVWHRLPIEKKKDWLTKGTIPTLTESYTTYLKLKELFGEVDDDQ